MSEPLNLTDLQLAILRVIWEKGGESVPGMTRALHPERRLAQSTVATVMSRLEKRGVLERAGGPREYVYRARVTEDQVRRAMVRDLTQLLFGGSAGALVTHLVDADEVAAQDLEYALELLQSAEEREGPDAA